MWNNDDDASFRNEGGFDNGFSMSGTPGQQTEKASRPKCLAPVTIKQILECPEEGLRIRNKEVQVVQVVGKVKSVDVTSVKIKYVFADFTGTIAGFLYLDNESDTVSPVIENTYCCVTGSIRSQGGSKHIMIFSINPVQDFNQILEHLLTVVYMPLKLDSLFDVPDSHNAMKQEMVTSYGGTTDNNYGYDIDRRYMPVFNVITKSMNENGMSMSEIQSALPIQVSIDQIRAALDYLVGEGHIFTTIDEHHFKSVTSAY